MQRILRKYESSDLGDLMVTWESASKLAHPFLPEAFQDQIRHDIPSVYLPNAETWVMEQDGQVIGFIALIGNEVGAIFVKAEFQGTGAGRALMGKAVELRGDLEVEVFKANGIGRKFYQRYGFELLSESVHEPTGLDVLKLKFIRSKTES
ncbi:putative N-acetyltransferase YjaB [Rubripirellula tenax]|uniref:Putative N-acetyltransferase YjaB n=1 Tax=Rubripirellula tenax TaxID=2528015 RepID=A0A5C6FFX6_9BACT|nr:GNAT family N-acetyltransferase [Rubripirellula tenax]TWU58549.1 putative N-acetyltransferase YjaB [Rubripirellula tenax]